MGKCDLNYWVKIQRISKLYYKITIMGNIIPIFQSKEKTYHNSCSNSRTVSSSVSRSFHSPACTVYLPLCMAGWTRFSAFAPFPSFFVFSACENTYYKIIKKYFLYLINAPVRRFPHIVEFNDWVDLLPRQIIVAYGSEFWNLFNSKKNFRKNNFKPFWNFWLPSSNRWISSLLQSSNWSRKNFGPTLISPFVPEFGISNSHAFVKS